MNIVLKNSLKNIFGKPFRTLLVVFSIFICCLCALLCFDLGNSLSGVLTTFFGSVSRADIMVYSGGSDLASLPEGFPEADTMGIISNNEYIYKEIDGEYCYVTTDYYTIYGIDVDEAADMEFVSKFDIGDGEIFISKELAEELGYKIGDRIKVHDRASEEVELTVCGIYPDDVKNPLLQGNSALVNKETGYILSCGYKETDILMVDIKDNAGIKEAKEMIEEKYPDVSIQDLFLNETALAMVDEIKAVFYLLFVITFLLLVFVTSSICNRIVSERMSFIGTLRSLGMSTGRTAIILLLENVLYAVLGSVPAVALYSLLRSGLMDYMFNAEDASGVSISFDVPEMSFALVAGVILGAVITECLIPLKAITKALNTSIRDIIFDNRDTEYKFSRSGTVIGLICLAAGILTFFFRKNILFAILCIVALTAALALLFPRILRFATVLIKKISDRSGKSSWALAAVEAGSRKSTVGSGVLSATAAAMCIVVYAVANAMAGSVSTIPYDCDVVMECSENIKYYTYIDHLDSVTATEPLYQSLQEFTVNDEEKIGLGYFYALKDGGHELFTGFTDLPESMENGSVLIDQKFAARKGLSEGDTLKVIINPESVLPLEREYKVQKIIGSNPYDQGLGTIILPEGEYKALFNDMPGYMLIKCGDPDSVKQTIETYGKNTYYSIDTMDELIEKKNSDNSRTMAVITAIIVMAVGMTAIGMISNQLIGFEGRKKECAVMLSTAMSRKKLSGVLLKEALITSVTAAGIGVLTGTVLLLVIKSAMESATAVFLDVNVDPLTNLTFFIVLTLVFTGTVLFPIKNLRKMKISEQIKYE